ncbi:hypothetical protein M426DRAFT_316191 [Hypoxylon sp. CI-4A]|nr:hypothetical protein M426DRAFT_316191 [Hypoxylon sp. CI-4A]
MEDLIFVEAVAAADEDRRKITCLEGTEGSIYAFRDTVSSPFELPSRRNYVLRPTHNCHAHFRPPRRQAIFQPFVVRIPGQQCCGMTSIIPGEISLSNRQLRVCLMKQPDIDQ